MRLSQESRRTWHLGLVAAWLLAALLLVSHARSVRDYLDLAGQLGLRGQAQASTPLTQIYPTFATDAQTWVRHSLSLLEGHDLRLRHTDTDNALEGREVHWNSAWAWAIAGAGKLYQAVNGGSIESSVEKATIWLGPFTLLVLVILLSTWLARRAGLLAGAFLVAGMTLHERMMEGFFASYCDHHGLLTVSVLGIVLGSAMMGAGWWRSAAIDAPAIVPPSRDAVRSGAVLSAVSGALGMWVSAASVIPAIALTGVAGLATAMLLGRAAQARGESFNASAWVLWGRVGAAGSLLFYLVEYFPQYMGWRLEVNHPLYALAWLGGGEFIARAAERWLGTAGHSSWKTFAWPTIAVLAAPITILVFGARVMTLLDPFMANLHRGIGEFQPLWSRLGAAGARTIFQTAIVDALPLAGALVTIASKRREASVTLVSTTMIAAGLLAMAWWQSRWDLNASAGEVVLALVLVANWGVHRAPAFRWALAAGIVLALYVPGALDSLTKASSSVAERRVNILDAKVVLSRDIAAALRASQPAGGIVMLSSMDTSVTAGYYGRFRTLGTPYWENGAGLKAAAAIWSSANDEVAARLLREHGVTHIALVRGEEFIVEYYRLANPGASAADFQASFGGRVLAGKSLPPWLHAIPYEVPEDLASQGFGVTLYRVDLPRAAPAG